MSYVRGVKYLGYSFYVMKLVKQLDIRVTDNKTDTRCTLTIKAPKTVMKTALSQLAGINSLKIVQQQS